MPLERERGERERRREGKQQTDKVREPEIDREVKKSVARERRNVERSGGVTKWVFNC